MDFRSSATLVGSLLVVLLGTLTTHAEEASPRESPDPAGVAFQLGQKEYAAARAVQPPDAVAEARAQKYFKVAAELGHPTAMFNYAVGLTHPIGTNPPDPIEAGRWYERAALKGVPAAAYNRGLMLLGPTSDSGDPQLAAPWLERAATNGLDSAQFVLGKLYAEGRGVAPNDTTAAYWFAAAARQGNPGAIFAWSTLIKTGRVPAEPGSDPDAMLRTAAERGVAEAQELLATSLLDRPDPIAATEATQWFLAAARQGRPLAQWQAGHRLVYGLGTKTNTVEGAAWMLVAGEFIHRDAQQELRRLERELPPDVWTKVRNRAGELRRTLSEETLRVRESVAQEPGNLQPTAAPSAISTKPGRRPRLLSEVKSVAPVEPAGLPPKEYREALARTVLLRFEQLVRAADPTRTRTEELGRGHVVVTYRLHADGTLDQIRLQPGGTEGEFATLVLAAFNDVSPYTPWNEEVRRQVGADYVDLVYPFDVKPQ